MNQMNRREFLQRSLVVGAAAVLPVNAWSAEVRRGSDVIELGPAKVKVSRMAIGTGSFGGGHSSSQLRKLGADGVADLWCYGFDNGVFFWDTADSYGTHAAVKIALKTVPREKVAILTKSDANSATKMQADLDRFRQEIQLLQRRALCRPARGQPILIGGRAGNPHEVGRGRQRRGEIAHLHFCPVKQMGALTLLNLIERLPLAGQPLINRDRARKITLLKL